MHASDLPEEGHFGDEYPMHNRVLSRARGGEDPVRITREEYHLLRNEIDAYRHSRKGIYEMPDVMVPPLFDDAAVRPGSYGRINLEVVG